MSTSIYTKLYRCTDKQLNSVRIQYRALSTAIPNVIAHDDIVCILERILFIEIQIVYIFSSFCGIDSMEFSND